MLFLLFFYLFREVDVILESLRFWFMGRGKFRYVILEFVLVIL